MKVTHNLWLFLSHHKVPRNLVWHSFEHKAKQSNAPGVYIKDYVLGQNLLTLLYHVADNQLEQLKHTLQATLVLTVVQCALSHIFSIVVTLFL